MSDIEPDIVKKEVEKGPMGLKIETVTKLVKNDGETVEETTEINPAKCPHWGRPIKDFSELVGDVALVPKIFHHTSTVFSSRFYSWDRGPAVMVNSGPRIYYFRLTSRVLPSGSYRHELFGLIVYPLLQEKK